MVFYEIHIAMDFLFAIQFLCKTAVTLKLTCFLWLHLYNSTPDCQAVGAGTEIFSVSAATQ